MKRMRAVFLILLLVCLPIVARGASPVPAAVLSAREGMVRVYSEMEGVVTCGSGFAVGKEPPVRYIVTGCHVAGTEGAAVTVRAADALTVPAVIMLRNEGADLCVLRLQTPLYDLVPLTLDDTDLAQTGDAIFALSFAADSVLGEEDADADDVTITDGLISALKSGKITQDGAYMDLIHFSAGVASTGGPLLNQDGRVVGVCTHSMQDTQNVNVAVSAQALIRLLKAGGVPYSVGQSGVWTWACVVAACMAVLVAAAALVWRRVHPRGDFGAWLESPAVPTADKLRALLDVARQVQKCHSRGRYPLDIWPKAVRFTRSGAALTAARWRMDSSGALPARAEFTAPERYTGGAMGPWSDVYALCALVYVALAGRVPAAAFEARSPEWPQTAEAFAPLAAVAAEGLVPDPARRPSLDVLIAKLEAVPNRGALLRSSVPAKPVRKRTNHVAKAVWVAAGLVLLVGAAALVTEVNYTRAEAAARGGDYTAAQKSLRGVVRFYRDAARLSTFVEAGAALESGAYGAAQQLFDSLGGYLGADALALEAAYRQAKALLDQEDYAAARPLLASLDDYRDAQALYREAVYQSARVYMEASLYSSALSLLETLGGYKDSATLADEARAALYSRGLAELENGHADEAAVCFSALSGYARADDFAALCAVLVCLQDGQAASADAYERLCALADTADLSVYFTKDALINTYLAGSWRDEAGRAFVLRDGAVFCTLPDAGSCVLRGAALYRQEKLLYRIAAMDTNTVAFQSDGNVFILKRER